MRIRGRLTRAGAGALLIASLMLAAGLMKTINLLILLGDLLIVLIILNGFLARRAVKVVQASGPPAAMLTAGRRTRRTIVVRNFSRRTNAVGVFEQSPSHEIGAYLAALTPGEPQLVGLDVVPVRRGVHPVSLRVVSGYPFGFIEFEKQITGEDPIVVSPALGRIDRAALRRWLHRGAPGEVRGRRPVARRSLQLADVRGVRPYRSGDGRRAIHWRTSARHNELMVREYDSPESRELVLLVEPWKPDAPTAQDQQRLEASLSLAATLLDFWCDRDESPRITLIVPDRDTLSGRASPDLRQKFFRMLAETVAASRFAFTPRSASLQSPRAVFLLVSSRRQSGELADHSQFPWQRVSPDNPPAWYHPPEPPRG